MYEQHFALAGLSPNEALLYETLLKNGTLRASALAKKTPLKRGLVYKVLEDLVSLGLVEKIEPKEGVAYFAPKHPALLQELIEHKARAMQEARVSVETVMPSLISDFNLVSGMPGVRFYEGLAGIEQVLEDSLTAQNGIYTYVDIDAVQKFVPDLNARYVEKRTRKHIPKKMLVLDTPSARAFLETLPQDITDTRLLAGSTSLFHSAMNLYNNKVSYITAGEEHTMGVIIENKAIYDLHAHLFMCTWNLAKNPTIERRATPSSHHLA